MFRTRFGIAVSGGGCKAFFGLGAGSVILEAGLKVTSIAGTSAGSAMACALLVGNHRDVLEYFKSITQRNPSNFHFKNLFLGTRPFPHERMYRRAVMTYVDPALIRKSKIRLAVNALQVPESRAATKLARARVIVEIMAAYRKEMKLLKSGRYHAAMVRAASELGLKEVVFHNEDFESTERAGDIILASSSVPPMVRFQTMSGAYFVDGGITRNLALDLLEPVDVAIGIYYDLWSRLQYERISVDDPSGEIEMRDGRGRVRAKRVMFLSPDRRLPIDTWDYANPRGVTIAFDAGRRAGEHLLQVLKKI